MVQPRAWGVWNCMRNDEFRAVDQCKVLCGNTLLQLRLFSNGRVHSYDVLSLKGTTWRTLAASLAGTDLSFQDAVHQAEERARLECGVSTLTFRWHPTDRPPKPSGRNRSWIG
jgi:hypothetical protein